MPVVCSCLMTNLCALFSSFNMLTGRETEYSTVVFTVGAAVMSILRWLIDLRYVPNQSFLHGLVFP